MNQREWDHNPNRNNEWPPVPHTLCFCYKISWCQPGCVMWCWCMHDFFRFVWHLTRLQLPNHCDYPTSAARWVTLPLSLSHFSIFDYVCSSLKCFKRSIQTFLCTPSGRQPFAHSFVICSVVPPACASFIHFSWFCCIFISDGSFINSIVPLRWDVVDHDDDAVDNAECCEMLRRNGDEATYHKYTTSKSTTFCDIIRWRFAFRMIALISP